MKRTDRLPPLPAHKLRAASTPADIPYADSREIPRREAFAPPQPRALSAVRLALALPGREHHLFVAGDEHLGRTHFALRALTPAAKAMPTPPDVVYVCDFSDQDKPPYLQLPAGTGHKFRQSLDKAVDAVRDRLAGLVDDENFRKRRGKLDRVHMEARNALFEDMSAKARGMGFELSEDENGLTLAPLHTRPGRTASATARAMSPEQFAALDPAEQNRLRTLREDVLDALAPALRQSRQAERELQDKDAELRREFAREIIATALTPVRELVNGNQRTLDYLKALHEDMLEHLDRFARAEEAGPAGAQACPPAQPGQAQAEQGPSGAHPHDPQHGHEDDFLARYAAHVLVDNSALSGAPIIVEDHPTAVNLMGCIERESEMGSLYTDFTLLKPGALHKANGGFLLLKVDDVLAAQSAWDALLRALRSGTARMDDLSDSPDTVRTKTVEPEPLPLNVKVVLVGTDEVYEHLLYHDPRFAKLFKVKAHLQTFVARAEDAVTGLLTGLATIIDDAGLPPFDREALAKTVDYASRLAEDQERLSLHMPLIRELMLEAAALARMENGGADAAQTLVRAGHVAKALAARDFRANLYEEEFMADYDRGIIKVATSGTAVGRVNGLSVSLFGDYEFGLPHHIACTVGVGREGILDLERESELGGPIHTKAMLILKSYLLGQFAYDKPLMLTGSLYFEQSYAEVEGDSASGAELAALLSALGQAPIDLSLAFTGAVNQSGHLMAVGGVTRKIEGFFEVCRRRGLTGGQGVIIPADNVVSLMLKDEVTAAVEAGEFHIYPAATVEDAMELLTGLPTGVRDPLDSGGGFPEGTLYARVDERLRRLAKAAREFYGEN